MKHDWQPYYPPEKSNAELFMSEPYRRCTHCGKVQQRDVQHDWGRVVGYRWLPLAGRCKGVLPNINDAKGMKSEQ